MTLPLPPYPNRPRDKVGRLTNISSKRKYEARQRGDLAMLEYVAPRDAIERAGL